MQKNAIKDIVPESMNLRGFWRAIVEDNDDPLQIGRVRIRIFGLHTDKKEKDEFEGIPTSELPWAAPCMPIMEGSVSGFGTWGIPLQGSHVMIFFENENIQNPMYFASVPGIPTTEPDTTKGFNDPTGVYPTANRIGESDVHRLARGVSAGTIVEYKNNNLDTGVSTALGGTFSEPSSPFAASYPHNTVIATHGGIIMELDSSPGAARFQVFHPSNSYIEVGNDGTMVIRNEKDKYEITIGSKNIHIKQDENHTVDGNEKHKVGGDLEEEVGGDVTKEIAGTKEETVTGAVTETHSGGKTINITGTKDETVTGAVTETYSSTLNITVTGIVTISAPSTIVTGGTVQLAAQVPGNLKPILNEDAATLYNTHTHPQAVDSDGDTQADTGAPNELMDSSHETANTTAS